MMNPQTTGRKPSALELGQFDLNFCGAEGGSAMACDKAGMSPGRTKGMRVALPALIPAFLICVSGSEALSSENALTGCLKNGRLTDLAIGDEPAKPCKGNETEISLPLGDSGETDGKTVPFFVTLDGDGSETTIAVNGSLELYARCELEALQNPTPTIAQDRVSLIVSSETGFARNFFK